MIRQLLKIFRGGPIYDHFNSIFQGVISRSPAQLQLREKTRAIRNESQRRFSCWMRIHTIHTILNRSRNMVSRCGIGTLKQRSKGRLHSIFHTNLLHLGDRLAKCLNRLLNVKVRVGVFNKKKSSRAFSVIVKHREGSFPALESWPLIRSDDVTINPWPESRNQNCITVF